MKSLLSLCVLCLVVALVGCKSDDAGDASMSVSPGAVSECGVNCECCPGSPNYKADANMGAVGDAATCTGSAATSTCPFAGKVDG